MVINLAVADPGFPVGGGTNLVGGGANSRCAYVSKNLYVKMKEFRPLGGRRMPPLDPPMFRALVYKNF